MCKHTAMASKMTNLLFVIQLAKIAQIYSISLVFSDDERFNCNKTQKNANSHQKIELWKTA